MTYRNQKLIALARQAPCMLELNVVGCGVNLSVACNSDMLRHGRGIGHKSGDQFAVPGCPACHAQFTRAKLGRAEYERAWQEAHERYQIWIWENGKVVVK